jgi:hypothetical protein
VTTGHVGDLDLAEQRVRPAHQLDEVPLADLGVAEVQVHPQAVPSDGLHQRQRVRGPGERHAGVVHGGVEVLQHERDAGPLAQLGDAVQRPGRAQPHGARP